MRLLQKQGKTILIAEHRLYYLMGLADRIVYLEQGRIEKIFYAGRVPRITKGDPGTHGIAGGGF